MHTGRPYRYLLEFCGSGRRTTASTRPGAGPAGRRRALRAPGVAWRVQTVSNNGVAIVAEGTINNGAKQLWQSPEPLTVRPHDVVSLIVAARDNDHACDTTHIELKLTEVDGDQRAWNLVSDVVDRILDGNPLPDAYGNTKIWHFCATGNQNAPTFKIPAGSTLANWLSAQCLRLCCHESPAAPELIAGACCCSDNKSTGRSSL